MNKTSFFYLISFFLLSFEAKSQPECYSAFKSGQFRKGDTIEAYYFMAAVYPDSDGKSCITYLSPIFQINARKSDTIWSRNGIGLFRYGVTEFKDSINSKYPDFGITYQGEYKDIVSAKFNPSRRIHFDPYCLNELKKFYYSEASKGKDKAINFDEFDFSLSGYKDNDFDTLVIKKYEGDLSKPAMIKELMKRKKEEK